MSFYCRKSCGVTSVLSWKHCVLALGADVLNEQRIHQYTGALTANFFFFFSLPPRSLRICGFWFLRRPVRRASACPSVCHCASAQRWYLTVSCKLSTRFCAATRKSACVCFLFSFFKFQVCACVWRLEHNRGTVRSRRTLTCSLRQVFSYPLGSFGALQSLSKCVNEEMFPPAFHFSGCAGRQALKVAARRHRLGRKTLVASIYENNC